jgi:hypothetical protein
MLDISKWTDTLRMAHVEDGCLGCVRRVLQAEGWPARSWQQDGLLVEDEGGRRLREGACATWALGRGDKLRTHG